MKDIKFIKTRDVKSPNRANQNDAGIDFFIPNATPEFINDFIKKNEGHTYKFACRMNLDDECVEDSITVYKTEDYGEISPYDILISGMLSQFGDLQEAEIDRVKIEYFAIYIPAHERILVPSGVKVWIEQKDSALIATNKSGIATTKGLVVGATTVDADYTGEVHLSVINTNDYQVPVICGDKLIQFIHTPVILSKMVEITEDEYNKISKKSDRGSGGFGSTGLK